MGKQFEFSVVAKFKDEASRLLRRFQSRLKSGWGAGVGGGFARMFGGGVGGRLAQRMASRPSGAGGFFADVIQGATGVLLLPVRILGAFARLIPGIGGVLSGVVGTASNILTGIVGIAANVVGSVVNVFGTLVSAVAGVFEKVVSVAGRILGGLAKVAGVAVAGATASFVLMFQSVVATGDELGKMAKRTGLSVEWLSEMQHVLELNDASLGDLQTAIRGMSRAVEGGVRGAGEYLEVWQALGVNFRKQNGQIKSSEKLFEEVVNGLHKVEDQTLRMGLAQRIFGRSGESMLALIDSTSESLAEQRAEARRLGATWSTDLAAGAEEVADAWTRIKTAWRGVKREFLGPFLEPIAEKLTATAEWLAGWKDEAKEWGEKLAGVFEDTQARIEKAVDVLSKIRVDWGGLWEAVAELKTGLTSLFAFKFQGEWHMGPLTNWVITAFEMALAQVRGLFDKLWVDVGQDLQNRLLGAVSDVAQSINEALMSKVEKKARARYEAERAGYLRGAGRLAPGGMPPWEQLPGAGRERLIGMERVGVGEKKLIEALSWIQEIIAGAQRTKGPGEKAAAKEAIDARTRQEMERGGRELDRHERFMRRALEPAGGKFKDAVDLSGQLDRTATTLENYLAGIDAEHVTQRERLRVLDGRVRRLMIART